MDIKSTEFRVVFGFVFFLYCWHCGRFTIIHNARLSLLPDAFVTNSHGLWTSQNLYLYDIQSGLSIGIVWLVLSHPFNWNCFHFWLEVIKLEFLWPKITTDRLDMVSRAKVIWTVGFLITKVNHSVTKMHDVILLKRKIVAT